MKIKERIICIIAIYTFLIFPLISGRKVYGEETIDIIAPVIIHGTPNDTFNSGDKITITSVITDNIKVEKARLYFRTEGELKYKSVEMFPRQEGIFGAEIPGDSIKGSAVEYYIEAIDGSDNHTLKGFTNNPMVISVHNKKSSQLPSVVIVPDTVKPYEEVTNITETQENKQNSSEIAIMPDEVTTLETYKTPEQQNPNIWYKKWWVWTIAGAVIVGVAAANMSGGDAEAPTTGKSNISW